MHSADWLRTLVVGVAGVPTFPRGSNTTGPMPDDSYNVWPAILNGSESPRFEIVHQVESNFFSEKVRAIRVGEWKLIVGAPGDGRILRWPEVMPPGHEAVPFGQSGGSTRDANASSCLAGIVADGVKDESERCRPGCLYNLTADPAETRNVFSENPDVAARLDARLKAVGAKAPPPASYWGADSSPATKAGLADICQGVQRSGFLEPIGFDEDDGSELW